MSVGFVDLPRQIAEFEPEIRKLFEDLVFTRADFVMRQDLLDFEKTFAAYVDCSYAIGVANGSDALNLCMKVLGIRAGDEVITVSHTFIATVAAVVHAGATPVLVDVSDDYDMSVSDVEAAITPRTKAIIAVHLNGRSCDMDPLLSLCRNKGLHLVEDSAQGLGAAYRRKKVGSFGVLSTNSFYPFKTLGCFGDGGMITTSSAEFNNKLRCLRDNGQDREKGEILYWGWNSRLDNIQAAILKMIMEKHLEGIIARRRAIALMYTEGLSGIDALRLPCKPETKGDYFDTFQNYVIRTDRRDALVKHLKGKGIGVLISWPTPNHFHRNLGLSGFRLPNTESISREVVSIPMHPALSDADVKEVISSVRSFFKP
jgi:dTDP-4-amino-4,6-dideoxygalactose transaminase